LGRLHIHERTVASLCITRRRAHLDTFVSDARKLPQRSVEILPERVSNRIRLAANRQAERIGSEIPGCRRGRGRPAQKPSSRDAVHSVLLVSMTSSSPLPHVVCRPTPLNRAALKKGTNSPSSPSYSAIPTNPSNGCRCPVRALTRFACTWATS